MSPKEFKQMIIKNKIKRLFLLKGGRNSERQISESPILSLCQESILDLI